MLHNAKLVVPSRLWDELIAELHRRTEGRHESGAFLLGHVELEHRRVERIVYYDELDPGVYRSGVVVLHARSFGRLWDLCRTSGISVVGDVHVHAFGAGQSKADRDNPMIAQVGHVALIVPRFAKPPVLPESLGAYEYMGNHQWRDFSGRQVTRHLRIE